MPVRVRRKLLSFVLAVLAALATAGAAAAANGGFTPVAPHSPNAHHIKHAYWVILGFTAAIFVLVEAAARRLHLEVPEPRPRRDGRGRAGARPHAARADLDGDPGRDPRRHRGRRLLRAARRSPTRPAATRTRSTSPSRATSTTGSSTTRTDARARSTTLHVPAGAVVDLKIVVARRHPQLVDPGSSAARSRRSRAATNHTWFKADQAGTYTASAPSSAASTTPRCSRRVDRRVAGRTTSTTSATRPRATIGEQELKGVCATCHGNLGPGRLRPGDREQPAPHPAGGLDGDRPQATARGRDARRRRHLDDRADRRARRVHEEAHLQGSDARVAARIRSGLSRRLEERPRRELARHASTTSGSGSCTSRRRSSSSSRGGILALLMRAQLATPNEHFLTKNSYNEVDDDARHDDGLPRRRPDPRRLRQLPRAADDRRARHGVPAPERALVLALPARRDRALAQLLRQGRRGARRLVVVPAAVGEHAFSPGHGQDYWILALHILTISSLARRDQLHRHDPQHAHARA